MKCVTRCNLKQLMLYAITSIRSL